MHEDIKKRFDSVTENDSFTRVDRSGNADFYVGRDGEGNLAFKFRGLFKPKKNLKSADGIRLNQYKNETFNTLQFTLCDRRNCDLFYTFCDDIMSFAEKLVEDQKIYETILHRFYAWKKMFSSQNSLLSENEVMGLIGELLFLKDFLFPRYGQSTAIKSWSGQELTHKDFSLDNIWYEVKTIHTAKNSISISSLEQLQSNNTGEIVVISLEKMSPSFNGININRLIGEIIELLSKPEDRDSFIIKITGQGFLPDESYNDWIYDAKSIKRYRVNEHFPALCRSHISPVIARAQYELLLPMLTDFLIDE